MPAPATPRADGLARFVLVVLCVAWAFLVLWANHNLAREEAESRTPNLPYGIFSLPDGALVTQDFAYNLLFLKGVRERVVANPYRFKDQEKLMRQMLPESQNGLTHAYSPVALVLALPFLSVSGQQAYLLYTLLCAAGSLLLYYFYIMPLVATRLQAYAFLAVTLSICLLTALTIGQSALITTSLLGAFWRLLKTRQTPSLLDDFWIAALFWALCVKPSVAVIPFALLLGSRAWRPLAFSLMMLLLTWIFTASYYGGWWTGFWDYVHLLNHYNNSYFTPYMQRGDETADQQNWDLLIFACKRGLVVISTVVLLILRWTRRISPSQHFQGMVWVFLLFSPYLMGSEYFILSLLIVEGTFFQSDKIVPLIAKLLLLASILDLRAGVNFPLAVEGYVAWVLVAWIVIETWISPAIESSRRSA